MRALLEMTDKLGLDYYEVNIGFERGFISIREVGKYNKVIRKRIKISKIYDSEERTSWGLSTLNFSFEESRYTFYNSSENIVNYLKDNLKESGGIFS